jgi:hypothetical protein
MSLPFFLHKNVSLYIIFDGYKQNLMNRYQRHIRILCALIFAAITVLAPVAKNYHVTYHTDTETAGETISEHCALCCLEFPSFEHSDTTPAIIVVMRDVAVFVPSILGHLCNKTVNSLVIRGPPEA